MITLSVNDAILLVRKNLDEVEPNGSVMYDDENTDNLSLDDIIGKNLPEAINAVQLAAPVQLLEGVKHEFSGSDTVKLSTDGILSISLGDEATDFLRLVAFQAVDSDIVLTDVIAEASPEGRKQLNPYLRGRSDRPRLVLLQGRHTAPAFRYYSLTDAKKYEDNPSGAIKQFLYIDEKVYSDDEDEYMISRRLRQNIADYLTAMVLETYGIQAAQNYYQKAASYPLI